MKHLFLVALLLTLVVVRPVGAGQHWRDGDFWKQFGSETVMKVVYVSGILDGLIAENAMGPDEATAKRKGDALLNLFGKMDANRIAAELDGFYRDPKNRRIATGTAVYAVALRAKLKTPAEQAEYQAFLEQTRKASR